MKTVQYLVTLFSLALTVGCTSLEKNSRRFLDSSTHENSPPSWVSTLKSSWEDGGKIVLKGAYTVKGNERLNGCFDLARMEAKESLLSEIASDIRGSLDQAQQSISENAELILGKVRSEEFSGRVIGLRFTEKYFERYTIQDVERLDCHLLSEIKASDYARIKREIVDKLVEVDPKL